DMRVQGAFIGETSSALWFAITHPHRIRWKDVWYTCEQVGVNALPIGCLISFLLGIILAFQSAVPMKQFGAEIFVADLVGLSILRELGPLMTAILLAGRSGAAFAAEIGTMKVNEELNALTTMGLDPVRFLVVTRIIAAVLMVPLLSLFADLIGVLAGGLTMLSFNIPIVTYLKEVDSIVDLKDVLAGLVKTPVFAILIAGIGCLRGLQTQTGASAVGISATRAVVSGIVLLEDVSFTIDRGEVFVILGGSGSGKSTLLKHMIGLYEPMAGHVFIDGDDIVTADGEARNAILKKIGVMYQSGALFGSMTLLE